MEDLETYEQKQARLFDLQIRFYEENLKNARIQRAAWVVMILCFGAIASWVILAIVRSFA